MLNVDNSLLVDLIIGSQLDILAAFSYYYFYFCLIRQFLQQLITRKPLQHQKKPEKEIYLYTLKLQRHCKGFPPSNVNNSNFKNNNTML